MTLSAHLGLVDDEDVEHDVIGIYTYYVRINTYIFEESS